MIDYIVELTNKEGVLVIHLFTPDDDKEGRIKEIEVTFQQLTKRKPTIEIGAYFCEQYLQSIDSLPDNNIIDASDCFSYLNDKNGVLTIDQEAIEGFERKTVYVTVPTDYFDMKSNIYMYCIKNLISIKILKRR